MKRTLFVTVFAIVAVAAVITGLTWRLLSETPFVMVVLKSIPSQATVFSGDETLGTTPCMVKIVGGKRLSLRVVRKDCRDAEVEINAADYAMPTVAQRLRLAKPPQPCERTVTLESTADAELIVKVHPAGAGIFLDGHQLGVAPLAPQRVAPGSHTLRLTHPECFAVSENISLEAGKSLVLERKLEYTVVAMYREKIRQEPLLLINTAELAHHYILHGEFAEAAQVLRDAMPSMATAENYQQQKYFEEMIRFYTDYYAYPRGDEALLRKTCREIIDYAVDKKIGNQQLMTNYQKQITNYDKNHPSQ